MTKKIYVGLLLVGSAATAFADDTISHTFFFQRPHFQSGTPERESFFRNDRLFMPENGWGGAMQVVVYGGRSTKGSELAKFFMPFGLCNLGVSEFKLGVAESDTDRTKDVEARNFNIETQSTTTTFKSRVSFCPRQEVLGIGFDWKQTLWWCNDDRPRGWFEVAFPVERVKTTMGLKETVISDGGGAVNEIGLDGTPRVGNMTEAFVQSGWKYGKIDNKCRDVWGVADVEVKFGTAQYSDCCQLYGYVGFVAPTGTKIDACYASHVFKPVVGNNHHWGFLFGGEMIFDIWESCSGNQSLQMATDLGGRILASNHQFRSFDLKDKQWGRYQEVYRTLADATAAFDAPFTSATSMNSGTSGINVFTKCVRVEPRYCADSNTALIYRACGFIAEVGYNLYVREAERICLEKWDETPAIKSIDGAGAVSLARNIGQNFAASDLTFSTANYQSAVITKFDLNLDSASMPAIIANTLYGALGYEWEGCRVPGFIGFGGSYEFSSVNTTLNRWTAWGKIGFSY